MNDKELLDELKKEIIRVGLQDNPSRTKLQEVYDKEKILSPSRYVQMFGSWQSVMDMIGLGESYKEKVSDDKAKNLTGKRISLKWADMTRDELMEIVLSEIREKDIDSVKSYRLKRDKQVAPSITSIYQFLGSWKDVVNEYDIKYGQNNEHNI